MREETPCRIAGEPRESPPGAPGPPRVKADLARTSESQMAARCRKTEEALRESEQRLAHAMRLAQLVDWEYDVARGFFTFSDRYYALHGTTSKLEGGKAMSAGEFARKFVHPDDAHLVGEEIAKAIATNDPDYFAQLEARIVRRDGGIRHVLVHISIEKDAAGRTVWLRGANQDITERKRAEVEIEHLAAFPRFNPNPVLELAATGEILFCNQAAEDLARAPGNENPARILPPNTAATVRQCLADGAPKLHVKTQIAPRVVSWSFFPIQPTNTVHCYGRDITEEERLHHDLLETSRLAGMAEVATSVLHNVGNVLNSVNISSSLLADKVRHSKVSNVGKAVALMREHEKDLAAFLTLDAKGIQLLGYLQFLANHLEADQTEMTRELAALAKSVEHLKEIVAMQQSYSRVVGISELASPAELAEDALRMNGASLDRHHIELVRKYSETPAILVEKHKVLQILVNLIRNAKYACDESGRPDKRLTVRVGLNRNDRVVIAIIDNGVGIPAGNMARIFSHGFTTRRDGHGFGLHSGALTARELGGSLTARSDGAGKGAEFALELPLRLPQDAPAPSASVPSPGGNGSGHSVAARHGSSALARGAGR